MKPNKPTRGPWRIDQYGEQVYAGNYEHATQKHICNVFSPIPTGNAGSVHYAKNYENERRANAHLIAAAPELLEALELIAQSKNAMDFIANDTEITGLVHTIRQAIAKARGEAS